MYCTKKYSICLQNVVELKYKRALNGNTRAKYRYLKTAGYLRKVPEPRNNTCVTPARVHCGLSIKRRGRARRRVGVTHSTQLRLTSGGGAFKLFVSAATARPVPPVALQTAFHMCRPER